MPINCSSNSKLDTLNAKKAELNAQVEAMQNAAKGEMGAAMEALNTKANAMKDALLDAVPEPPVLPNFKKELEELRDKVGEDLSRAKAAFKERWGDALPDVDIDGLMSKVSGAVSLVQNFEEDLTDFVSGAVSNIAGAAGDALSGVADAFDFCKDVPNIEAPEVSPEGKVEKIKVKAAEPIVAADIPKKVEEVEPTVVAKEKLPSVSPKIEKPVDELKEAQVAMAQELNRYLEANAKELYEKNMEVLRVEMQGRTTIDGAGLVARQKEKAAKKNMTLIEYYNTGIGRKPTRILVKKYSIANAERTRLKEYRNACMYLNRIMSQNPDADLTEETQKQIRKLNHEIIAVRAEGDSLIGETLGGHGELVSGYSLLMRKHLDIIAELRDYKV